MKNIKNTMAFCLSLLIGGQAIGQTSFTSETLRVWMDDATITANGESITYITVYENDIQDYTSFNMSLIVPKGIRIGQVKSGRGTKNAIELSVRAAETHSINCNMPTETQINIICTSSQNDNFYPDDEDGNLVDELFSIGLVADPSMINGTYTITTEGVKFVLNNGDSFPGFIPETLPSAQITIVGGKDGLTIPYSLKADGIGTLCLPFDSPIPYGLQAYIATAVVGGQVELEKIDNISGGTPVVLIGAVGDYTFTGMPMVETGPYVQGVLCGTMDATEISTGYVLQNQHGRTAFYYVDENNPVTVPAYRCWLSYHSTARMLPLNIDLNTLVNGLETKAEDLFYDLSGRPVQTKHSGIYVKKGKKKLIK